MEKTARFFRGQATNIKNWQIASQLQKYQAVSETSLFKGKKTLE